MNGINLFMLGIREPSKYGSRTLDSINSDLKKWADGINDLEIDFFVTNFEGEFVEKLYASIGVYDGIVMNPGAWTHYSVGIRDAIAGCGIPCVEVHMTDINSREDFRKIQITSPVCVKQLSGYGEDVYRLGVEELISYLENK